MNFKKIQWMVTEEPMEEQKESWSWQERRKKSITDPDKYLQIEKINEEDRHRALV